MKTYTYTVRAAEGLHARPAGQFVKLAGRCQSTLLLQKGEKTANAKRILAVMGLGIRQGERVTFLIEGPDEDAVLAEVIQICRDAL